MTRGALTAAGAGEEIVPSAEYRALRTQVSELQRLLGKKTMEAVRVPRPVSHDPPGSIGGRQPANTTMRPRMVVVVSPEPQRRAGMAERQVERLVEAFVAQGLFLAPAGTLGVVLGYCT